jgi:PAS domain S-box-containing protein
MNPPPVPRPFGKIPVATKVVGVYLIVGCLWIFFSDQLLSYLAHSPSNTLTQLQTLKGWFYVLATAVMLFWLINQETRATRIATIRLKYALEELQNTQRTLQELNAQLEQRVAERTLELQTLSDRLMEAQEVAHVGIWEYDISTGKIFWSNQTFQIFGLTVKQQEPDYEAHLTQNFPPEERQRFNGYVRRALDQAEPYEVDVQIIRADGSTGWILAKGKPILNDRHQVVRLVGVVLDITERKAIEVQQQLLSQMKDDFLSTVSHELRSPLASIRMALEMVELMVEQLLPISTPGTETHTKKQQIQRYLGILSEQCDQELELVNNLLDLQRLEAERIQVSIVPIHVMEWVSNITAGFEDRMQKRQQHLQMILSDQLPPLSSDIDILTRIFGELLTNACKYTPPGETITVNVGSAAGHLQLKVSNSGVQIAQDQLDRIFEKFYRIPKSDHWQQGGTGLGLALIKEQMEYLGGSLWADSDGSGVHFVVRLPLDSAASNLKNKG